ncbi:transcription initiation factor TFIID subunit 8 isoform X2 [Drosophila virilis]|uniref:transcription initiation factor TFIID subunit 8 isoform X2 n=1 Tax=Drosophila virilis TaxID=7244 RepID=UPI001395CC5A|nr:transcription initiation factor TFIID subunit 8 isoform X2 [Drosophila virilis]
MTGQQNSRQLVKLIDLLAYNQLQQMNPYEEILGQVMDQMLMQKDCNTENKLVHDKLVVLMRYRLRDIAVTTSNAACHAGRSTPCYFDVERTFRVLGIGVRGLRELRDSSAETQPTPISFSPVETRDEDIHQSPQLDINQSRGLRSGRHIPKYMPPFPGVHTYKNTMMDIVTDRGYVSERQRRAELQLSTQRALNRYYLRTRPAISLFIEPQRGTEFMVLNVNVPKKPAYLTALMPRDEVFDVDIYEFNEPPNERARNNPFMKKPHDKSECNQSIEEDNNENESEENDDDPDDDRDQEHDQDREREDNEFDDEDDWQLPNLNDDDESSS